MTARVLVVDDIDANVRLLEARLMAEYFQVLTASNGHDALEICAHRQCDIVLLDVMMPEMDGFEVCRRLKADPKTMHIPVVMVTALDQAEDRVTGLQAGADDFLTKPVNDLALVTRVKSLVRLKMLTDELRLRAATGQEINLQDMVSGVAWTDTPKPRAMVVDDRPSSYQRIVKFLSAEHSVTLVSDPREALFKAADEDFDVCMISMSSINFDPLRLCSQLKSLEKARILPLIVISELEQEEKVMRALEMGVNDYIRRPLDRNELLARVRTQVKRKRYNMELRKSVEQTLEMAVSDSLTGLHNRRYLDNHLPGMLEKAVGRNHPLSFIMCDIDHFKAVNDTYGHDIGDEVIREFAKRLRKNIRGIDLACRYGGEEFVVVMPDTDTALAEVVAERIRTEVAHHPFGVAEGREHLSVTVSMGIASMTDSGDTPGKLIKRADVALYNAKRGGRNTVSVEAA